LIPQRDEAAYGACQQRLADALRYLLYSSNTLGPRVRALGGVSARPLQAVCEAMVTASGAAPDVPAGRAGVRGYADALAECYRAWDETLAAGPPGPVTADHLPAATAYEDWCANGGADPRYESVHRLRALLSQPDAESLLLRAYVHGSVATLDDVAGFSDLDLALVVRREALLSPDRLLELRRLGRKVVTEMLRFDPYMHHGPHWLAEPDLAWYPAAGLPPVVLAHGLRLSGDNAPVPISVRASDEITETQLETFQQFFGARVASRFAVRDRYELEWVLGSALLLPALHLQRTTNTFRYKRDTFEPAERDFTAEEWSPIAAASSVRAGLPPRAAVPPPLAAVADVFGAPELIRQGMRLRDRSVVRAAREELGADFPLRMLRFLDATGATGDAVERLLGDVTEETLTDLPQQTPRTTYERAIELAVERWMSLPDPPRALYQLGQVGAPGISDLDFVVVLEPGKHDLAPFAPRSFPSWARELLVHPPYFCTPETWPDLNAWFPAFDLRHLGGEDLRVEPLPAELELGCALGLAVDFLITKVPRDLLWVAWMRPLPVRLLLGMLHSVRYTAGMAERAGIHAPAGASDTWQELDALRRGWHDLPGEERPGRLASITRDVVRRALELTEAVADALPSTAATPPAVKAARPDSIFHFVESWGPDAALMTAEAARRATGRTVWPNPASFQRVLGTYAEASPALGAYLRRKGCALPTGWRDDRWDAGLRHHARAMTAAGEATTRLGVPSTKYIAFGYPPTPLRLELARGARSLVHGGHSPLELARRLAGRLAE